MFLSLITHHLSRCYLITYHPSLITFTFGPIGNAYRYVQQSFANTITWLEQFIIGVPMYVAGPAMMLIGAVDSSLLSLPEINDYLVVMRCATDRGAVFYFPLFAAIGSVIGCNLLYTIVRRGGQAILRRRFKRDHIERVERAYARFGFLALAIPALLPPPMPFKIFVATAGTLEYPRWRFIVTIMIARSVRYYVEGILAVYYGVHVMRFIKDYGAAILGGVLSVCLIGLVIYFVTHRKNRTIANEDNESTTPKKKDAD